MMLAASALRWQDHTVIVAYLAGMLILGTALSRRQQSDEEYFLGGRLMPWLAVGVSVIASLLSSLTYLSEPGEIWNSGITHMFGKMLAIPFEMVFVFLVCVPFMMRFRYTSAYEYLGDRFGWGTRTLGVVLFMIMVVLWMGFVVLASSRALAAVSGMPLWMVIGTVGVVATIYTMLGGLRAVIWTDVVQVILLVGGGLFTIGYVAWTTGTGLPEWMAAASKHLQVSGESHSVPLFSLDPTVRATVITVALNMFIWHVCTHTANQMTVQRYFSTSSVGAARRSFITGSLLGVGLNLMLMAVGLALVYFYFGQGVPLDNNLDASVRQERDLIFPTFAVHRLPPGVGGGILAALLAAAMSSIDSGINSMATVLSIERHHRRRANQTLREQSHQGNHVTEARWMTAIFGAFITVAAFGLDFLPQSLGIVDAMPRTFNAVTGPLGGLFFVGMFLPRAGGFAASTGALLGMATSIGLGYRSELSGLLQQWGLLTETWPAISFTWVMPSALAVTIGSAALISLVVPGRERVSAELTWRGKEGSSLET
ncbi:Sodium/glucose cotransporter [Maioricimonas rarisocia]|uniref:Sodium/glucose cotransporter n=1 Tax=Maioricimonas rarisocia TaxID=2528026 RepID=A0A517Z896_9PLAN|nr:sodium/solute symporter [Maioricimonas rarisocia]QDU38712.1 Sodium/glucose cotransporter [Maioricimonas rarisocia]